MVSRSIVNSTSLAIKHDDRYIQMIIESLDNVLKFINSKDSKYELEALIVIQSFVQKLNDSMFNHLNETSNID